MPCDFVLTSAIVLMFVRYVVDLIEHGVQGMPKENAGSQLGVVVVLAGEGADGDHVSIESGPRSVITSSAPPSDSMQRWG